MGELFRLATQPHRDAVKLGGAPDFSAAASYDVRALNEGGTWCSGRGKVASWQANWLTC